jgi:farnesyl-diphosphate farnesyltransferase
MEDELSFNLENERIKGLEYCRVALPSVSRSFALTIPMLDAELRDKITVGYVVARVLDTIEDSPIPLEMKKLMMDEWIDLIAKEPQDGVSLRDVVYPKMRSMVAKSSEYVAQAAYGELMKNVFKVYVAATSFDKRFIASQHRWYGEMKDGMKKYLTKRISSFEELDEYTYYVAGTVGGFLTDLVCEASDEHRKHVLKTTYKDFGLLLQKVNIIRDFREDVKEGRYFWPKELFGAHADEYLLEEENSALALKILERMTEDAKSHMVKAKAYIDNIPDRFSGYRMFSLVNFYMAVRTLELMENNKEVFLSEKPVKMERREVEEIIRKAGLEAGTN